MDEHLVSVIIPVYNTAGYLQRCVESVLRQTHRNIEVILIDDGSTDDSGAVIDEYAKRDTRIVPIHTKNAGVSAARNRGIETARGSFLMFVDSDDYVDRAIVEKLLEISVRHDLDTAACAFAYVYLKNGKTKTRHKSDSPGTLLDRGALLTQYAKEPFLNVFARIYRRACVADTRFDTGMRVSEDSKFVTEAAANCGRAMIINDTLYYYCERAESAVKIIGSGYLDDAEKAYGAFLRQAETRGLLDNNAVLKKLLALKRISVLYAVYLNADKQRISGLRAEMKHLYGRCGKLTLKERASYAVLAKFPRPAVIAARNLYQKTGGKTL